MKKQRLFYVPVISLFILCFLGCDLPEPTTPTVKGPVIYKYSGIFGHTDDKGVVRGRYNLNLYAVVEKNQEGEDYLVYIATFHEDIYSVGDLANVEIDYDEYRTITSLSNLLYNNKMLKASWRAFIVQRILEPASETKSIRNSPTATSSTQIRQAKNSPDEIEAELENDALNEIEKKLKNMEKKLTGLVEKKKKENAETSAMLDKFWEEQKHREKQDVFKDKIHDAYMVLRDFFINNTNLLTHAPEKGRNRNPSVKKIMKKYNTETFEALKNLQPLCRSDDDILYVAGKYSTLATNNGFYYWKKEMLQAIKLGRKTLSKLRSPEAKKILAEFDELENKARQIKG